MRAIPWSPRARSWFPLVMFVPLCSACSLIVPGSEHFIGGRDDSTVQVPGDGGAETLAATETGVDASAFEAPQGTPDTADVLSSEPDADLADHAEAAPDDARSDETSSDVLVRSDGSDGSADAKLGHELLQNPSFERGWDANGWEFDPPSALTTIAAGSTYTIARVEESTGIPVVEGTKKFTCWNDKVGYTIRAYQILSGLGEGTYVLSAHFSASDSIGSAFMYAKNCGGPDRQVPIPPSPTGYVPLVLDDIAVSGGSCEVDFVAVQDAIVWINADLFSFRQKL